MTNRQAAIRIIRKLRGQGFQALLAGGCVRDMLLKRQATDYDVATDAKPDEIIRLFRRTLKIGAQFGVVIVMMENQQVEVATFRTETDYSDGRRPDSVEFTDAEHDASRRDFTVNGMFYDPVEKKVIDYVGGQKDMDKKILRTIGQADERFGEDYLRMLRAIRFSVRLGFKIAPATWNAIRANAHKITAVSGERIAVELEKILANSDRASGVKMLTDSRLAETIFPGYSAQTAQTGIDVLTQLPAKIDFALGLAAAFAGFDTPDALRQIDILKCSNAHRKHLKFLLEGRGKLLDADMSLANLKIVLASPYFWDLYEFQRAIQKSRSDSTASLAKLRRRAEQLAGKNLKPKPLLDGHELIALGVQAGPTLGLASREMYIAQLGEEISTPSQAGRWVELWLKKHKRKDE